ncbi:hypothetical protein TWF788_006002, partial [Orbilia oligospora]
NSLLNDSLVKNSIGDSLVDKNVSMDDSNSETMNVDNISMQKHLGDNFDNNSLLNVSSVGDSQHASIIYSNSNSMNDSKNNLDVHSSHPYEDIELTQSKQDPVEDEKL